ncbi:glycosyltransferase family 4 protein [Marinococcus halotolerans]|uniref:glycosyltransferase family 4 protein n=1 Tax=Marinococcus halotolerans TaxID=301092 RepID=UPI0003B35DBC|nr:glycosyltransferase family 4 protein [Marinococcus halotolerans]
MKILLVSNMYPSDKYPSYGTFVRNSEKMLEENGIKVENAVLTKHQRPVSRYLNYGLFYVKTLIKALANKYDAVYVHYPSLSSIPVLVAGYVKKLNVYVNIHGSDVVPENMKQKIMNKITVLSLKRADKIICPSEYFRDLVIQKHKIPKEKLYVFPSGGVNPEVFYERDNIPALKQKYGLAEKYTYIGFISRLDYGKGWDTFLESIALLRKDNLSVKGIVVGGGGEVDQFWEKVNELGIGEAIIHYGALKQEEVAELMNCFKVFCFPTERKGESLGLVGLEALASKRPVVGSSIGGLKGYIRHGENGYLVSPGDKKQFAYYLGKVIYADDDEYECMKDEAYKMSKKYVIDNIKDQFIRIFRGNQ